MSRQTLLIELGTTELPPKALKLLSEAFHREILNELVETELVASSDVDAAVAYATPRRLAIQVPNVLAAQADQLVEKRGPATKAAFDDNGDPTQAAQGFAKSCGVDVDQLQRLKTDKGEWLSYQVKQQGQAIDTLLGPIIDKALKKLPIPKRMRWGDGEAEFVRPVQWLVTLHADRVIDIEILGVNSGNLSRGHRFHSDEPVLISHADNYQTALLEHGNVIASFNERQQMIAEQLKQLSESIDGVVLDDPSLLDEVTGLVEYPTGIMGRFDQSFLEVPSECLISSMRDHQKYFHVYDKKGGALLPNFITISNIQSKQPERVVSGNERVLRARLADAEFFWQTDLKTPLETRLEKLGQVTFHAKLGSVQDKVDRLQALAARIAKMIGANIELAQRGAKLAKADLVSDMVGEFDELQGLMGRYYAQHDGENQTVADCIEQHYWPKFSGDKLPESVEAQSVALADRLDSLVGIYAAGEVPTGDKDPYALRRAALSILRILIEQSHPLGLAELVNASAQTYADTGDFTISSEVQTEIVGFIRGRLTAFYQSQGLATSTINSVMACEPDSPLDFENRVKAVSKFIQIDEANDLAAANKRISNILKKQTLDEAYKVDQALLVEKAEVELYQSLSVVEQASSALFDTGDYAGALQALSSLRNPVDAFFDQVMVMADDKDVQKNRLALLDQMRQLFLRVADISLLQN